jgi:triosephosphate isomerase
MNMTVAQSRVLIVALAPRLRDLADVDIVICPPLQAVLAVHAMLAGSSIGLGAQNLHWESRGAFTGEVSATMLKEFCQYVIVGHSERRTHFQESDQKVNLKLTAAAAAGLTPILCVGENLEQYDAGETGQVILQQVIAGLEGLQAQPGLPIVVAYEPVWAIGTGRAATGETAADVISRFIRPALERRLGEQIAATTRVLYGGSVTPANAHEFFAQPEIDGALVGGASLDAEHFVAIARAAAA